MSASANRLAALFSGVPSSRRDRRPLVMLHLLQAHIDDSKTGEDVVVLAGYIAHYQRWQQFTEIWDRLLKEEPRWEEFKMKRAINHLARAEKFYRVVEDHAFIYVASVVEMKPLRQLCDELGLHRFCRNPYNWGLKSIAGATYMQLGEVGLEHPIEFIFDERGEEKHLRDGWPFFVLGMPPHARSLVPGGPRFEKSKDVLPLQAAEIIAWHAREHWLKHKNFNEEIELSWPAIKPVPGNVVLWDYAALKPNMESLRALLIRLGAMADPDL